MSHLRDIIIIIIMSIIKAMIAMKVMMIDCDENLVDKAHEVVVRPPSLVKFVKIFLSFCKFL